MFKSAMVPFVVTCVVYTILGLFMGQDAAIVCLSSSYAGIFEGTGMLKHLKEKMERFGERTSAYGCVLGTALVTVMIACNQSLPIILTSQICDTVEPDRQKLAIDIENTAVVLAPLIPWNIAGMVPLATISVPAVSILAACYLYMIPLWNWYTNSHMLVFEEEKVTKKS